MLIHNHTDPKTPRQRPKTQDQKSCIENLKLNLI
jgi:hypothetical protein